MTQKSFSLVARNKYLELLSEFIVEAMRESGYKETMTMKRPDNPQIWEFNNEGKIISMTISPHQGNLSSESLLNVEAESKEIMEDVFEIIGTAIALLITHFSKRVFKAIDSSDVKRKILKRINNRIKDLTKGL